MKRYLLFLGFATSISLQLNVQGMFLFNEKFYKTEEKSPSLSDLPRSESPIRISSDSDELKINKVTYSSFDTPLEGALLILLRHMATESNQSGNTNPTSQKYLFSFNSQQQIDFKSAITLKNIGELYSNNIVACSDSTRGMATAAIVAGQKPYIVDSNLGEQALGILNGQPIKIVKSDPGFIQMTKDANYKISQDAESGNESTDKVRNGVSKLMKMDPEKKRAHFIVIHGCSGNWFLRFLFQNPNLILDIPHSHAVLATYNNSGEVCVFADPGEKRPKIVSPDELYSLSLTNPVLKQYTSGVFSQVTKIMNMAVSQKAKVDKKLTEKKD